MTRKVFMETLERMLSDVSFNDRYDALSYYKEYFDDAGITEDMVVPESVGTPEQIAMRLKKSINSGENITSENINIGGTYNRDNTSGSYNTKQNTGNSYNNSQNAGQYSYNNSQNTAQYEYNNAGQYNKKNNCCYHNCGSYISNMEWNIRSYYRNCFWSWRNYNWVRSSRNIIDCSCNSFRVWICNISIAYGNRINFIWCSNIVSNTGSVVLY